MPPEKHLETEKQYTDADADRGKRTGGGDTGEKQNCRDHRTYKTGHKVNAVSRSIPSVHNGHNKVENIQGSRGDGEYIIDTPEPPAGNFVPDQTENERNNGFIQNIFGNIPPFPVAYIDDDPGTDYG